jgi:hypothetical protein
MRRALLACGLLAFALVPIGCDNDRHTDEILYAPPAEYATRYVMACPRCGAPTKPFRINATKSYYRCSGQPPKFTSHKEKLWSHVVSHDKDSTEQ